jgi:pyruvate,water dikinase
MAAPWLKWAAQPPAGAPISATDVERRSASVPIHQQESVALDKYLVWFKEVGMHDVGQVGGKNASLGEMIRNLSEAGVKVPQGFATTARAYYDFIHENDLFDRIQSALKALNVDDVNALAATGARIRQWILDAPLPKRLEDEVRQAFRTLTDDKDSFAVAVRSSATAEDLPDRLLCRPAGDLPQHPRHRPDRAVAIKRVYASLFNDRAIAYRVNTRAFDHNQVGLSAGCSAWCAATSAASGVHVHPGHRVGLPRRGLRHRLLRPGRDGGAGGGQSRRVLCTSRP